MLEDVKEQVINEMKASLLFSLQVDETTDVACFICLIVGFCKIFICETSKKNFCFVVNWKPPQEVQILWEK